MTYDGVVTRLRRAPRTPPRGVGVVHLGQRVPELSFVLNDEAGSEVEAAAVEVMVADDVAAKAVAAFRPPPPV